MTGKLLLLAVTTTACLGPRVDDTPGASAHLLPSDATVPSVTDDPELTNQIALNDGIDDRALATAGGTLMRGTGSSAGDPVRFWLFGPQSRAPSPIYQLLDAAGARLPHPPLVDAVPGDPGYSPLHAINQVVVTDAYRDQLITTIDALGDAIELGLVEEPVPAGLFVATPIVLPGTQLEVGDGVAAGPEVVYARGYEVGAFRFGGDRGPQPGSQLLPTRQVSFLRAARGASYDAGRPIFQATIPDGPAVDDVTYTPLSVVVNVDLAEGVDPETITDDSQLFVRSGGAIQGTTPNVTQFQITSSILMMQLQFTEGSL